MLDKLHDVYGVDTSDDMLRKAVEEHNEVCRLITEIGEYRKEENPRITGYEFHVINLVTYCCPKYLIIDKLRETAEELKQGFLTKRKIIVLKLLSWVLKWTIRISQSLSKNPVLL